MLSNFIVFYEQLALYGQISIISLSAVSPLAVPSSNKFIRWEYSGYSHVQAFTQLTSLKKLRLDSCGQLRCHPDVSRGLMRQLDDISLRQCRLGSLGCLDVLLGLRTLRVSAAGLSLRAGCRAIGLCKGLAS